MDRASNLLDDVKKKVLCGSYRMRSVGRGHRGSFMHAEHHDSRPSEYRESL